MVYLIATVVLLGMLIFVHELGHFLFAKALGVKVERFSLGFPPKMIGKQIGETEYVLSWVPLGGYVKMFGENPDEEGAVPPELQHRSFSHKPTWKRFLIVFAGPFFNFVFAFFVYWAIFTAHGVDHLPALVGRVTPDSPAAQAGIMVDDRIVAIGDHQIQYYDQIDEAVIESQGRPLTLTIQRGATTKTFTVTPITKHQENLFGESVPMYVIGLDPYLSAEVGGVQPNMPAQAAGIEPGDVIKTIDGKTVANWYDVLDFIRASEGREVAITVDRNGRDVPLKMTPKLVTNQQPNGEQVHIPMIGIERRDDTITESINPVRAVYYAGIRTYDVCRLTIVSVVKLIQRKLSVKTLGGPIFIAQLAGEQAKAGMLEFISLAAVLSISLGILNLLPIPVLDGGHLFFFLLEMIFRRPISLSIRERAQQAGLVVLIMFMAFIFYNDIARIVKQRFAEPPTTIEQTQPEHESTRP
jgi:regulator of sigma E protease